MKIRLVSHASVVVACSDTAIWTDPWLEGRVFNNSWSLLPSAEFDHSLLRAIDFIWISHEHPDHLHFPSLKSLPDDFKKRVKVLYQLNNPERIFEPLRRIGYRNFLVLPHRRKVKIGAETGVYCFRAGTIDSCLAVANGRRTLLNVNDARLNGGDCRTIRRDLGTIDVALCQFSLAVHNGRPEPERYLREAAHNVLESLSSNHQNLGTEATIPFASLMYFSAIDNRFMNAYANRPCDVYQFCAARRQKTNILYPGDECEVGLPYDSGEALTKYERLYAHTADLQFEVPPVIPLASLRDSFERLMERLRARYPRGLLRLLRPLRVELPDLQTTVRLSLGDGTLSEVRPGAADLVVYSQPFHYGLNNPWGFQTLTISARFTVPGDMGNWLQHKALFALHSADVYLKPGRLLRRQNRAYLIDKLNAMRRYSDRASAPR